MKVCPGGVQKFVGQGKAARLFENFYKRLDFFLQTTKEETKTPSSLVPQPLALVRIPLR